MVFSSFSYIHTRKSIFSHLFDTKFAFFTPKSGTKWVFCRQWDGRFRMVAQNFRPTKKSVKKLPYMSKNGKNVPKMPLFRAKNGFFLCKIHKKTVFTRGICGQGERWFWRMISCRQYGKKPLSFVQNHQNGPLLCWLTESTCAGIMGAVPDLTQFPPDTPSAGSECRQHDFG